jgi:hypothetical protein
MELVLVRNQTIPPSPPGMRQWWHDSKIVTKKRIFFLLSDLKEIYINVLASLDNVMII